MARKRCRRSVPPAASAAMCSCTQRVWTVPAMKLGCARISRRNGMLVPTPSMRHSLSARVRRPTAAAKSGDGEWAITLASNESNAPLVRYPA